MDLRKPGKDAAHEPLPGLQQGARKRHGFSEGTHRVPNQSGNVHLILAHGIAARSMGYLLMTPPERLPIPGATSAGMGAPVQPMAEKMTRVTAFCRSHGSTITVYEKCGPGPKSLSSG